MNTSPIWFLNELELYKTVKPYRLDFDPANDDVPRTNVDRIEIARVPIHDIRDRKEPPHFPECGFTILDMPPALVALNYGDKEGVVDQYYPYIENLVQAFSEQFHKGVKVIALDHKARLMFCVAMVADVISLGYL